MKYYIGIANSSHDPAVAVLNQEGEILFAEAHERYFQKKKAWDLLPAHGERVREIIETHCNPDGEFIIASTWKTPGLFSKQLEEQNESLPEKAGALDKPAPGSLFRESDGKWLAWSQKQSFDGFGEHLKWMFRRYFQNTNIQFRRYDHHLTHAAMGCYTSPYKKALCLIVDGEGEVGSTSSYIYGNGKLKRLQRSWGAGSLGSFYAKITELCKFEWRKGEEGKVMGLAAYGAYREKLFNDLAKLIKTEDCRLNFLNEPELGEWLYRLEKELKQGALTGTILREDIAHNGQGVFELIMTQLLNALFQHGVSENLVLGGGCALNSSYNGKIIESTPFSSVHVPCAPADDGNALGACFLALHEDKPEFTGSVSWQSPYLGSSIISGTVDRMKRFFPPDRISHHPGRIHKEAAKLLANGQIIGWIQGRAEYGQRALGNRSILADPRAKDMKDRINTRVKFREAFRPFAPVVPEESATDWFDGHVQSPYMSFTRPWKKSMASQVPAVVHKDGTGRLQTVTHQLNPKLYNLLKEFAKLTRVPILLNTSLNIMGKPIVHSLEDALGVFYTTGLDALVIDDLLIRK